MQDVRITLAQIAPKLGDIDANVEMHRDAVGEAASAGSGPVVFPELSLTGYVLRDMVPEVALRDHDPRLEAVARLSASIDVVVGYVEESPSHKFYNAAAYFSRGQRVHVHRKLHLPTYGLFQEGRDFAHGESLRTLEAPFGTCGMLVCEDLWHLPCAWLLAQQGAELLLGLSNGPTQGAKPGAEITSLGVWQQLVQVTARFLTCWVVYVNRVGCEDGLSFGGGSLVIDPFGRITTSLPALDERVETVQIDADALRRARTSYPLLRDAKLDLVQRELDRIRRLRYDLPEPRQDDVGAEAPPADASSSSGSGHR